MAKFFNSIFLLVLFLCSSLKAQDPLEINKLMFAKTAEINTLSYQMRKRERFEGELIEQISDVKFQKDPFKIYIKQVAPKEGVEVLYKHNSNSNKALINPNGFPWVNLNLDPLGSTMRKKQHHTLYESGFDHLLSVLRHLQGKYSDQLDDIIKFYGETVFQENQCYVIEFENPHFKYQSYKVHADEDIDAIARKFMIGQQMIREKNPEISDWYDLDAGMTITIPNDYCPKMRLYVDSSSYMPVVIKVYDEQGLYEHYEYLDLQINTTFSEEEFSADYEEYGF